MALTIPILKSCIPHASDKNISLFLMPLNNAMEKYSINSNRRVAAFLAQLTHESGSLVYVKELATGDAYESGRLAQQLGNVEPGDGRKFKGRGLIQITGRSNYSMLSNAFGFDFIKNPELLEQPGHAAMSAAWFWDTKKLNQFADIDNFEKITRLINGGLNGQPDRLKNWEITKKALNVTLI